VQLLLPAAEPVVGVFGDESVVGAYQHAVLLCKAAGALPDEDVWRNAAEREWHVAAIEDELGQADGMADVWGVREV
jgi:hypothetical protein